MLNAESVLAESDFAWVLEHTYQLTLEVYGSRLRISVDGQLVFEVVDTTSPLLNGAIALVVEDGCFAGHSVVVRPVVP